MDLFLKSLGKKLSWFLCSQFCKIAPIMVLYAVMAPSKFACWDPWWASIVCVIWGTWSMHVFSVPINWTGWNHRAFQYREYISKCRDSHLSRRLWVIFLIHAHISMLVNRASGSHRLHTHDYGILLKGPYLPCLCMADWALLVGYPRCTPVIKVVKFPIMCVNSMWQFRLRWLSDCVILIVW